jgi:hypothetical protein
MAKLTPQQINAAFFNAYGRNANAAELSYWGPKASTALRATFLKATLNSFRY